MSGRGTLTIETANTRIEEDEAAVSGAPAGDYVTVRVRDNGCGMAPEVRERAFDPFFTTKEAGKGTGLGLAQVYGFVTRCGGHCAIDSAPGQGTTITIHLPRYTGERGADDAANRVLGWLLGAGSQQIEPVSEPGDERD
jgi:signal transduction histidine kinase